MNTAIVAMLFVVSRILGFVREVLIAARFGTGETYDTYIAAFRIPDLLFAIVMSGAFGSAFIPIFGSFWANGDTHQAWKLANALLGWTLCILAFTCLIVLIFAKQLVTGLIAPDLTPEAQDLAVNLTRLLLLSPLFLGLGAAAKGILEAQDLFTLPALAPVLYNLGIIGGTLFLVPPFGIYGLAFGVIIGAASHVGIQFAYLLTHGLRLRPTISTQVEGLSQVARLAGSRILTQFVGQSNLIVMTNLASRAVEGSIAALFYGQHLVMLPHGILAMSLSTVIFPRMSRQFGLGQIKEVRETLVTAIGPLILLTLLAVVMMSTLSRSLVQVTLQYGNFDHASTTIVAEAVMWLSLGLLARSLIEPLTRGFYAMQDTRTPLIVSILAVLMNTGLSIILLKQMGFAGLALSLSISYTARMGVLALLLSRKARGLSRELGSIFARMLPAVGLTTTFGLLISTPLARVTDPVEGRNAWDYIAFGLVMITLTLIFMLTAHFSRVSAVALIVQKIGGFKGRMTRST